MAASLNRVFLMGNVTRDPEVRYTPKGTAVCTLGVAVNEYYTTQTGEQKEETVFVDVDLWGRQAETAGQYLAKGRPVFIEGRLRLDQWDDKETGQKRSRLKVVCTRMQLIGGPRTPAEVKDAPPSEEQAGSAGARVRRTPPPVPVEEPPPVEDDNVPF
ncbi:MAG: single-stranded DNA-binding protein [Verrucomicrobiae bacterium]|nr:single-stranded DNA-binding protein [Verrucomicrobiae bacterium]MDW8344250.1 single-stranded DNA-binding protein [Verrucomicrobiae bacterium]